MGVFAVIVQCQEGSLWLFGGRARASSLAGRLESLTYLQNTMPTPPLREGFLIIVFLCSLSPLRAWAPLPLCSWTQTGVAWGLWGEGPGTSRPLQPGSGLLQSGEEMKEGWA